MTKADWWIVATIMGGFIILQWIVLYIFLHATYNLRDAMSRLHHTMIDVGESNARIEAAYKMLLLHNAKTWEKTWGKTSTE